MSEARSIDSQLQPVASMASSEACQTFADLWFRVGTVLSWQSRLQPALAVIGSEYKVLLAEVEELRVQMEAVHAALVEIEDETRRMGVRPRLRMLAKRGLLAMDDVAEARECPVRSMVCAKHGFVHGGEAEELRSRVEDLLGRQSFELDDLKVELQRILDVVDARDSLAFLEASRE